jgi:DNA-binding CsgD family transcriptional regulator
VIDAFRLAAVGTREEINGTLADASGTAKALLRAVLAQYDGDVEGAVRVLRHQLKLADRSERAYIADVLAPILIMRHENAAVLALADVIAEAGWKACAHAFRALAAADTGNRDAAIRYARAAEDALAEEADDIVRFRVIQRLARTAFYLQQYEKAIDLALSSSSLAAAFGAWRARAAGYSIAYNVHHNVTGDVEEADRFARLWHEAANNSGDESFLQSALVAEYELAVQFGDEPRVAALERIIAARLLPQQYMERFPLALSHAIVRGHKDLVAMRTLLQVLRDMPGRSRGEWSLCTALIALSEASEMDEESARHSTRAAIARLGRAALRDPAYERRYRRLARACIAAACVMLGDDVRADRTVGAREARMNDAVDQFPALIRASKWQEFPPSLQGIARVVQTATRNRLERAAPAGLTPAEFEVLRLLGSGWSAGRIARATHRSVNTVYNHTRAILTKLEAGRAAEAVAIARGRGLIL